MRSILTPPQFVPQAAEGNRLTLASGDGALVHIFVLEADIVRVVVLPDGAFRFPRTWCVAPGADDVPDEGRDRFACDGFACPAFRWGVEEDRLFVETALVRLVVALNGFYCTWHLRKGDAWVAVCRDRPTQAYDFGWWDGRVHHYLVREPGERYFGLGERSGDLDRAGRRFRMRNMDAFAYDAGCSDPLYKHMPFYTTWRPSEGLAFGLFYDTLADCTFDMGCERSGYHGFYRSFVAEAGDLDLYFVAGPAIADVTRRFTWLTGRPAFMPRWSLGYSGSTMSYTEAPDAQTRMTEFLSRCRTHDVLCDSFHLSSGYTSIGRRRYVFHWNRDKFPDPAAFAAQFAAAGVRLCPNLKPCLLADHPLFAEARERGLLIREQDGTPHFVQFWDGAGAYLDFTNPATLAWWKDKVARELLDYGLGSTWNDNNEFEIASPAARMHGFGSPRPAIEAKPLQSLLMMRASRQAQQAHAPDKRPFVVSRAGAAGMQRYAQTWSGDNTTSWDTLRYNLRMGLGLALSGVSNTGHDVGGFAGPKPDPELFVRWVQFGIFMPRFSIHSWNDDGTASEPWMHPETARTVSDLIKLRYRLIPTLYDLLWRHHARYEPVNRPTFHDFPDDPRTFEASDDMMVGQALLVAPVVAPGLSERSVYLPRGARWHDYWSGEVFDGGAVVTRPAPWTAPVMFLREGGALALNLAAQSFGRRGIEPAVLFAVPARGELTAEVFDDDGESMLGRGAGHGVRRVHVRADAQSLDVAVERMYNQNVYFRLIFADPLNRAIHFAGKPVPSSDFEGRRSIVVAT